jgi:hypothetical protein
MCKLKDDGRVCHLKWLATTSNIWKHKNNVIFNGVIPDTLMFFGCDLLIVMVEKLVFLFLVGV